MFTGRDDMLNGGENSLNGFRWEESYVDIWCEASQEGLVSFVFENTFTA